MILALMLSLFINAVMFLSMPKAQSMVIPFSAVGDYSIPTTYVTVEPSTEFPLWHWVYSLLFVIVILLIVIFSAIHLSLTKNITNFTSVGAIIAILFCCYMTFASPYSQFAIGTATIYIHVVDDSGNPIQNVQCYLYANNVYRGLKVGASGTVTFSSIPIAGYYSGKCYCPTDSSKQSPEYKDIIVGITINVNTYITNCIRCTPGVQKCTSNVVYTCTSSQNWQATKTCSISEVCQCSGSTCSCSAASCGSDGMKCIDSTTLAECKNGVWTNNRVVCLNGCSNNKCNRACVDRWKCKDAYTAGYQRPDCSWSQLINCAPGTCIDDGEQGYCSTPDTTVVTTTRTTTTRPTTTTTPTTTTSVTTQPYCNFNGICENPENLYTCPSDCGATPTTTTITTVTTITTTTTICPPIPIGAMCPDGKTPCPMDYDSQGCPRLRCDLCRKEEPDYFLYAGIAIVVILLGIVGYLFVKKKKP